MRVVVCVTTEVETVREDSIIRASEMRPAVCDAVERAMHHAEEEGFTHPLEGDMSIRVTDVRLAY